MYKITLFIFLFIVCSCSNNNGQSRFINPENLVIPDTLLDFFPMNEDIQLIRCRTNAEKMDLPYMPSEFYITYYTEIFQCNDDVYLELKNKVQEATIRDFDVDANNYFIIDDERYLIKRLGLNTIKELYFQNSVENLSFSFHSILNDNNTEFYDSITLTGLTSDFHISILKSGNEFIISDTSYKYNWDVLSEKNKHGYIGGVAYSDKRKILIYTVVAW